MKIIHKFRTKEEDIAIYKTLKTMRKVGPIRFNMRIVLTKIDTTKPDTECNSYGCIAGHCAVANFGKYAFAHDDSQPVEIEARDLMGLTHKQARDLFTPDNVDADYNCNDLNDIRFVNHRRGVLALWYFAKIGKVQWNNERLEKFVAAHPLPRMRRVTI